MKQLEAVAAQPPRSACGAWQNVELRHLRYFVAVAEAGSFTDAAERMFIAQPTLSQQLRRLEDIIGARLLDRRREGVRLTQAGVVLLEASRAVLSLVDHGVSHTRQAAGLGRQRLRVVVSPHLIGITLRVASRGQRLMRPPPGGHRGGVVGRRPHQGMTEPDLGRPAH
jgi:DNA-binding transcriptional LysR family regulator